MEEYGLNQVLLVYIASTLVYTFPQACELQRYYGVFLVSVQKHTIDTADMKMPDLQRPVSLCHTFHGELCLVRVCHLLTMYVGLCGSGGCYTKACL